MLYICIILNINTRPHPNEKTNLFNISFINWHLIAFCRLRKDYRDFVLSRIHQMSHLGEYFKEKRLTLKEYIQKLENSSSP